MKDRRITGNEGQNENWDWRAARKLGLEDRKKTKT